MRAGVRRPIAIAVALLSLSGCDRPPASAPPPPASAASAPASVAAPPPARSPETVTVLFTTDEHGWLLPLVDKGKIRGGAAEILGHWVKDENHCPGRPPGAAPGAGDAGAPGCADPTTLLLSGGDNWTGPAISSYFNGDPMVEAMARMGYAASAFGNHEFDFGRDRFVTHRAAGGYPYLAANMVVDDPALAKDFTMPPYLLFDRRGAKIGVVGVATEETLKSAMASRFKGSTFGSIEAALDRVVPQAWKAGADTVLLLAHECPDKLEPILARHPEWRLSFAGGGHCHKRITKKVGETTVISPGWRLHGYARVRRPFDPARAAGQRLPGGAPPRVDFARAAGAPPAAPPDPEIARTAATWSAKVEEVLGEAIGYTAAGFEQKSPELGSWIAESWRAELETDVAIVNSGGLRQSVPKGIVKKTTVYSVLPFDNHLLICSLTGKDLALAMKNDEAIAAGLKKSKKGEWVLATGKPLDPERRYSVATIDFLYYGGSGFLFEKQDPSPKETGLDWRTPVIAWTKKQASREGSPLERKLEPPRTRSAPGLER